VEFRILGPLEVAVGGRLLELGRPKQRAVLAILLVHANRTVSLEHLVDELWGEEPPAQAIASLQAYVSHLRRLLEPAFFELATWSERGDAATHSAGGRADAVARLRSRPVPYPSSGVRPLPRRRASAQ